MDSPSRGNVFDGSIPCVAVVLRLFPGHCKRFCTEFSLPANGGLIDGGIRRGTDVLKVDQKDLVSVFDCEDATREKLPKTAYDYYRSGANDEITLHENHAAYERIRLHLDSRHHGKNDFPPSALRDPAGRRMESD